MIRLSETLLIDDRGFMKSEPLYYLYMRQPILDEVLISADPVDVLCERGWHIQSSLNCPEPVALTGRQVVDAVKATELDPSRFYTLPAPVGAYERN